MSADKDNIVKTSAAANVSSRVDVKCLEEQRKLFKEAEQVGLVKGDIFNVVDARWLLRWKKFVGLDGADRAKAGDRSAHPGPIDLSLICDEQHTLKDDLKEEEHYILVRSAFWKRLVKWYGILDGYEPIERRVVEFGDFVKERGVEVYLINLRLVEYDNQDVVARCSFSRVDSMENVLEVAKEMLKYDPDTECRLWIQIDETGSFVLVKDSSSTVVENSLSNGNCVMLEQRGADGQWQYKPSDHQSVDCSLGKGNNFSSVTGSNFSSSSLPSYSSHWGSSREASVPGVCGLTNLGNTCFMNSALQCLSNTAQLTGYFLKNSYRKELNKQNPLGMKGLLATAYADLLRLIWSGSYSAVAPREFKLNVSRFAPQFSGYAQHDSQELLAFLLDGLHEDLNRIIKKPYVELKSSDGRPDEDVAVEAWGNHLKRNDSIIVDMFQGQLKSTLVCPVCKFVSVTFDPFMFLSLPLPVKKTREIEVTLVYLDPAVRPKAFVVSVPKAGTIHHLMAELASVAGIQKDQLLITDHYTHCFYKIYGSGDTVSHILDRDIIFAYEVDIECSNKSSDIIALPVYHRQREKRSYSYYSSASYTTTKLFGWPFFVSVSRHTTYRALYQAILKQMSRYVSPNSAVRSAATTMSSKGDAKAENLESSSPVEGKDLLNPKPVNALQSEDVMDSSTAVDEETPMDVISTPADLFQLSEVNSYGNTDFGELADDGEDLKLTEKMHLALDWNDQCLEKCYDIEEAEQCEQDDTITKPPTDSTKKCIDLTTCIELFTSEEKLGEDDPWYCPKCKEHQQATKKFDIWRLPKFLVIHLKRFSYSRYSRNKLETRVEFPVKGLSLSNYCINPGQQSALYDLYAISNHYGGLGGGHYTAYAQNINDKRWYHFDDSSVTEVDQADLCSASAYVLCYAQQGEICKVDVSPTCEGVAEETMEECPANWS